MNAPLPLWAQRLPPEVRRRLEIAEAAAREARSAIHAEQALATVRVFSSRLPFDEGVEHYLDAMELGGDEADRVRTRTLASLSDSETVRLAARERHRVERSLDWRYATPAGAVRFVRRTMRRTAEEELWTEMCAARAEEALTLSHVQFAIEFAQILEHAAPPTRAAALYLDLLGVPAPRARVVYQRALARLADEHLPHGTMVPESAAMLGLMPSRNRER